MSELKLFDVVALRNDLPSEGILAGQLGTIVEVYNGGEAFEVEFVDPEGRTYGLLTLEPSQLVTVHFEPSQLAA